MNLIPPGHMQNVQRIRDALILRREAVALGEMSDQELQKLAHRGEAIRVVRRAYMLRSEWDRLYAEGRMLAATLAQARLHRSRRWVFTHESAAAIWGLPMIGLRDRRVHVATSASAPHGSSRSVRRHAMRLGPEEIVERAGMRITDLARTMLDLACTTPAELALGACDVGLRRLFPVRRGEEPLESREWLNRRIEYLERHPGPGTRRARSVLNIADPRADSPAESLSRLQLVRLAIPFEIQVEVPVHTGSSYWADFEFLGCNAFGEVDGRGKYLDEEKRRGRTLEEVLLDEKDRFDEMHGITAKRFVRWSPKQAATTRGFGEMLARYGIRSPRL